MPESDRMNNALMFSTASDEWATPQALFDGLNAEFRFVVDVAATHANKKAPSHFGPDHELVSLRNALTVPWFALCEAVGRNLIAWMNPPYSQCREFITKAAAEARKGGIVVCLVPARTDTKWWHEHVWDGSKPRDGVEVRFLKGRVKFGEGKNSAPFPSVVVIFRGAR